MDPPKTMQALLTPESLISLLTLTAMEIVLGIDNIVFLAILTSRLPPEQRNRARKLGLLGAMGTRLLLLITLTWVINPGDGIGNRALPCTSRAARMRSATTREAWGRQVLVC